MLAVGMSGIIHMYLDILFVQSDTGANKITKKGDIFFEIRRCKK